MSRKHLSCQSTRHTLSSHDLTSNVCRTGQTANQIPEPSHCIFLIECRAAIAWLCRVPDTNEEQGKREVHLYCAVHCNPSSLLRFYFCFFFFSILLLLSHIRHRHVWSLFIDVVCRWFFCAPLLQYSVLLLPFAYICVVRSTCSMTVVAQPKHTREEMIKNKIKTTSDTNTHRLWP